jgi:hypothetical protein
LQTSRPLRRVAGSSTRHLRRNTQTLSGELSVGDVVAVDAEFYACADTGWTRIDQPRLAPQLPPVGARRWCFHLDETMHTADSYLPAVVFENEPGYHPLTGDPDQNQAPWLWGHDLDQAKRIAAQENRRLGLTSDDVAHIIASSMQADH